MGVSNFEREEQVEAHRPVTAEDAGSIPVALVAQETDDIKRSFLGSIQKNLSNRTHVSLRRYMMPYKDKEKQAKAKNESYLRNKEIIRKRDRERLNRNQRFVKEYKSRDDIHCKCGEGRWQCLDFHHTNPENYWNVNDQ